MKPLIEITLNDGAILRLTPDEAKELYATLHALFSKDEPFKPGWTHTRSLPPVVTLPPRGAPGSGYDHEKIPATGGSTRDYWTQNLEDKTITIRQAKIK